MKKTLKILSVVLLSVAMLFAFAQPVAFAKDDVNNVIGLTNNGNAMSGEVGSIAGTIINWIWGISILVAIIVVMVIGIKFIIGGTQEKAEYKKSLMPVAIGVILVVFATTLVKFLFSMG
ncbi:MAG: TrbC/VirB2 family protein [Clostridia bacterium]|nr:TrbC/VirB2 family protein [Clostridia bacterium]